MVSHDPKFEWPKDPLVGNISRRDNIAKTDDPPPPTGYRRIKEEERARLSPNEKAQFVVLMARRLTKCVAAGGGTRSHSPLGGLCLLIREVHYGRLSMFFFPTSFFHVDMSTTTCTSSKVCLSKPSQRRKRPKNHCQQPLGEMQRHVYIRIPVRALINLTGKGVKSKEIER